MSEDNGYNQAIYLLKELDFDPVFDFFVIIPLHRRVPLGIQASRPSIRVCQEWNHRYPKSQKE